MKINVLKTAIIGPSFVGKTVLCQALTDRTIDREYTSTIGVDYLVKYNKRMPNLSLWDLAGLERFQSIIGSYIRESAILVFCYSAESVESFYKMKEMYNKWKKCQYVQNKRVIIVITKTDSKRANINCEDWVEEFASEHCYPIVKTSSFNGNGIKELYNILIDNDEPIPTPVTPRYKFCCII
jgi:small GTP-binding protein